VRRTESVYFLPVMRPLFACVIVLFALGCGRKAELSPQSATPVASSSATNIVAAPAAAPAPTGADMSAVLSELTQALRKYSFEHQRLPRTFDELSAAGYVKDAPAAPAGKRFEIDPKTVRIVIVKQ
jgi:hypothetical protein